MEYTILAQGSHIQFNRQLISSYTGLRTGLSTSEAPSSSFHDGSYEANKGIYQGCECFNIKKGDKYMTIYEELVRRVDDGESFHIDFEKRNMKVGNDYLIYNEQYEQERMKWPIMQINDILDTIEDLYFKYKHSLPSERSESRRRKYFKALPIEQISDEQLMVAERRETSCARLEGFILCMILENQLEWDKISSGWFWQSNADADLVILKKWIENK